MIVVDSSAIVAIFGREPDAMMILDALERADTLRISAASVFESSIVARSRRELPPEVTEQWLDDFLRDVGVAIEPVLLPDLHVAREAHIRFGKGTGHPARLNFGDCFSYALAKRLQAPLLFKGGDFIHTDIASAL